MKPNLTTWITLPKLIVALAMTLGSVGHTYAQLPDCSSGNTMYAIFNDSAGSTAGLHTNSEIRPVTYATGAVGALMGSTTYLISKKISGTWFYGSAGLGVDVVTNRFFAMTQMAAPGGPKDIVTINTLTTATTVIGTTPSSLDAYHFVKVAVSPTGIGYAIGVLQDTTSATANTANPIIKFTTCGGTPTVGCSTITLLGYITPAFGTTRWDLFNGDIAFNNAGDLFFATASFGELGSSGVGRYKDARLFKIPSATLPTSGGSGLIPMTLVADYNSLDSTVVNGISLDPSGAMYFATRRFNGIQGTGAGSTFTNQLYKSTTVGVATIMPAFARPTAGYSIADLASCYFPTVVLRKQEFTLAGTLSAGNSSLGWNIEDNSDVNYFEIQRSEETPDKFTTVSRVYPTASTDDNAAYKFLDNVSSVDGAVFYRIRKVLNAGMAIYSNVVTLYSGSEVHMTAKPRPNPVVADLDLDLQLRAAGNVTVRLIDANGRMVRQQTTNQPAGISTIHLSELAQIQPGIYIVELAAAGQTLKEKIVKR
jgi:hypothetical protein